MEDYSSLNVSLLVHLVIQINKYLRRLSRRGQQNNNKQEAKYSCVSHIVSHRPPTSTGTFPGVALPTSGPAQQSFRLPIDRRSGRLLVGPREGLQLF